MKLLYLSGTVAELDAITTQQLARIAPQSTVTTVATAAEALVEIRKLGGFHALLTSPSLAQNETLALIASLRTDRVPIAIVPVVGEAQQDFLTSAVGAGADDVLVLRGDALVHASDTLTRIRQSPHLFPADDRRLRVLYAGRDPVVWDLLEQMPFVRAEQATCAVDGGCAVRMPGSAEGGLRCDVVVVDEKPDEAHPLQVVKSIKSQASDLPVVVLSPPGAGDISTAAFDLGADDAVLKSSAYRRRLVATLRRVHQRLELSAQHATLRDREARLRQIVETMPEGLTVIAGDGTVLAMNAAGLALVGAARPREIVGRDFCMLVVSEQRGDVRRALEAITAGEPGTIEFDLEGLDQTRRRLDLRGVRLERDARGGRGVIATLRIPGAATADLDDLASANAREQALQTALAEAETRVNELRATIGETEKRSAATDEAIGGERARWEAERTALESRVREAEATAGADGELQAALKAARAELSHGSKQHESDRAVWDAARAEFGARLQAAESAGRAGTELEAALVAARAELAVLHKARAVDQAEWEKHQHALELHVTRERARERGDWEAERRDAEARLLEQQARDRAEWESRVRAEWEQERQALEARASEARDREHAERDDVRRTLESRLNEMRVALTTTRQELDARREDTRTVDAARADLEAALESVRGELKQLADRHATERAEWDETRRQLEARIAVEPEKAREAWEAERRTLETRLTDDHARARAEWDEAREYLETRCAELIAAAAARPNLQPALDEARNAVAAKAAELATAHDERADIEASLEAAQGLLRHTTGEHKADRARWEAARQEFEGRLHNAREASNGRQELETALDAARAELRQLAEVRESERAVWEAARAERDRMDAAHAAERAAWDGKRRELESRLADLEADAGTRERLTAALDAAQADLREAAHAHAADRAAWNRTREDLERERREADDARIAERHRADAAERANDERMRAAEAIEQERHQLDLDRVRLVETVDSLRAAHAEITGARTAAIAERDKLAGELDGLRRKFDQEHTRRALLEAAVREARREAEGRLAVVEAEFVSARNALQGELGDTSARLERLTEETRAVRQRLEDALAGAAAIQDRLLGSGLFGHALMTPDGLLVQCNDTFARIFGYGHARDAMARTSGRPFPGLAGRAWLDARLASEGRVDQVESNLERIDGRSIRVVESAVLVTDQTGQDLVDRVLVDRTGSMAQDARLQHANRLEEVGTLVAAMAPDIESLIASVGASGSALAETLPPSDARREHTGRILAQASQAGDLLRQLAAFSVKQVRPTDPVDLGDAVRRSERILRQLMGPHVVLKTKLGRADAVAIGQDDLDQLLSALVVAGRDLLPIGGTLTIETARAEVDEAEADPRAGLRPGAHLRLSVTASGYGVQPAQRTAALDAITSRMGGHLRANGEPGRTAEFRVYLPRFRG